MKKAPQPTTLELAILGLLALEPQSGYDLMKLFETTAMGNYSSSPGAIYPALRRLEKRRLVDGEVDRTRALRPRKVFRPTAAGSKRLEEWLRRPITVDDVRRHLDELLLRFAFHSLLEEQASRDFLAALADRVDEYVAELREQRQLFSAGEPPHGRMAFELGLEQYRATARWARKALRTLKEES
jgi:PadR family transcriptional regulator, phenolic acid-responsive transcriptional regulator